MLRCMLPLIVALQVEKFEVIVKEKTQLLEESQRQKEHLVGRIVTLQQQLEASSTKLGGAETQLAQAEARVSRAQGQADDYRVSGRQSLTRGKGRCSFTSASMYMTVCVCMYFACLAA